jgi:hypothetical protein
MSMIDYKPTCDKFTNMELYAAAQAYLKHAPDEAELSAISEAAAGTNSEKFHFGTFPKMHSKCTKALTCQNELQLRSHSRTLGLLRRYIYICMCVCVCVCVYIYICLYVCMYVYIYI